MSGSQRADLAQPVSVVQARVILWDNAAGQSPTLSALTLTGSSAPPVAGGQLTERNRIGNTTAVHGVRHR